MQVLLVAALVSSSASSDGTCNIVANTDSAEKEYQTTSANTVRLFAFCAPCITTPCHHGCGDLYKRTPSCATPVLNAGDPGHRCQRCTPPAHRSIDKAGIHARSTLHAFAKHRPQGVAA